MRRFLTLLLLLLILPLHFSWAAAASYCGHERNPAPSQAAHVGHHEHEHHPAAAATVSADAVDSSGQLSDVDEDCVVCHLSCVPPLACVPLLGFPAPAATHQLHLSLSFESHIAEVPQRPDCSRPV